MTGYRRTSQIEIGVEPDTGRPSVALDGVPLDSSGGWQAAVDAGFAQVAERAERLGEPISVVVVDTASDWTGRFVVQADRSIAEDVAPPPPPRRRRGPLLVLLTAAAVLVAGSAVVVGTQGTSSEQRPASAPAAPPSSDEPDPVTRTPGPVSPSVAAPRPALPPVTLPPLTPPTTEPPGADPPVTAPPITAPPRAAAPPRADAPAPRGRPDTPPAPRKPAPRKPDPEPAPAPKPAPAPQPAPRPAPAPRRAPPPAAPVAQGRVVDGLGACLGARATALGSGSCLPDRPDQIWTLTTDGRLRTAGGCLTEVAPQSLAVQPCRDGDPAQAWRTGSRLIVNAGTGACALVRRPETGRPVAVTVTCGAGREPPAQFVS